MPGYSKTPLAKKHGIAAGAEVVVLHAPVDDVWPGLTLVVRKALR